jgi:dUTPase
MNTFLQKIDRIVGNNELLEGIPVLRVEIEEVKDLSKTQRGAGGFGSTGIKNVQ